MAGLFLLQPVLTAAQRDGAVPRPGTEILWDSYGVPHIFARDARSLFYAFGWAQMQSHGDLILRLYGQARGRAAEYWGEDYIESDRWVRVNGIPDRADRWYRQTRPEFRAYIDAFVAGLNAYARENVLALAEDERIVLPILPSDVLAHTNRVIHYTFLANPRAVNAAGESLSRAGSNAWAIGPSLLSQRQRHAAGQSTPSLGRSVHVV